MQHSKSTATCGLWWPLQSSKRISIIANGIKVERNMYFYNEKLILGRCKLTNILSRIPRTSEVLPCFPLLPSDFSLSGVSSHACCQSHFSKRSHLAKKENPTSFSPFFPFFLFFSFFLFFPSCSRSPHGRSICAVPLKIKISSFQNSVDFPSK